MNASSRIVAGSGCSVHEVTGRPKFRILFFVALVWLPVALCASLLLYAGVGNEDAIWRWLSWAVVFIAAALIILALFFRFTEKPHRIVERYVS